MLRLQRAHERRLRRERRDTFAIEKRFRAAEREMRIMLFAAGLRPTRESDGAILWQAPTRQGPPN